MSLGKVVLFFSSLLFWTLIFPLGAPLVFLLFLVRRCVTLLARLKYPNCVPICGSDLVTLSVSVPNEFGLILTLLLKLEGTPLDLTEFRKHFSSTFLCDKDSVFYEYIQEFGGYSFRNKIHPEKLVLEEHFRQVVLEGKEFLQGDGALNNVMISNTPHFCRRLPPWEIVLVKGNGVPGTVVLLRIDHSLVDATSLGAILHKLTGTWDQLQAQVGEHAKQVKAKMQMSWVNWAKLTFFSPVLLIQHTKAEKFETPEGPEPPLITTPHSYLSTTTLDIRPIKALRRKIGCRVIPIMLSAQAEAMSKLAEELGHQLPPFYNPSYSVPVHNHPALISGRMCNHWSTSQMKIALGGGISALERLNQTQASFQFFMEQRLDVVTSVLLEILALLPVNLCRSMFQGEFRKARRLLTMMSSVVLSPEPYYLLGRKVTQTFVTAHFNPKPGLGGTGISTFTRGNDVDVVFRVQNDELVTTQELADHFVKDLFPAAIQRLCEEGEKKCQ